MKIINFQDEHFPLEEATIIPKMKDFKNMVREKKTILAELTSASEASSSSSSSSPSSSSTSSSSEEKTADTEDEPRSESESRCFRNFFIDTFYFFSKVQLRLRKFSFLARMLVK